MRFTKVAQVIRLNFSCQVDWTDSDAFASESVFLSGFAFDLVGSVGVNPCFSLE